MSWLRDVATGAGGCGPSDGAGPSALADSVLHGAMGHAKRAQSLGLPAEMPRPAGAFSELPARPAIPGGAPWAVPLPAPGLHLPPANLAGSQGWVDQFAVGGRTAEHPSGPAFMPPHAPLATPHGPVHSNDLAMVREFEAREARARALDRARRDAEMRAREHPGAWAHEYGRLAEASRGGHEEAAWAHAARMEAAWAEQRRMEAAWAGRHGAAAAGAEAKAEAERARMAAAWEERRGAERERESMEAAWREGGMEAAWQAASQPEASLEKAWQEIESRPAVQFDRPLEDPDALSWVPEFNADVKLPTVNGFVPVAHVDVARALRCTPVLENPYALSPGSVQAAAAARAGGDADVAVLALEAAALRDGPRVPDAWAQVAEARLLAGRHRDAALAFSYAAALSSPERRRALIERCMLFCGAELDPATLRRLAGAWLDAGHEKGPSFLLPPDGLVSAGDDLPAPPGLRNVLDALRAVEVTQGDASLPFAHVALALLLGFCAGRPEEALASVESAFRVYSFEADAAQDVSRALLLLRSRFQSGADAVESVGAAIEMGPEDPHAWLCMGRQLSRDATGDGALRGARCLLRAAALRPKLSDAWDALETSLVALGRPDLADAAARRDVAVVSSGLRAATEAGDRRHSSSLPGMTDSAIA